MVGLGMRSFFNHTTPIPDATKTAAILSGKQRFHGYLDMLAKNLRKGESILSDVPLPEFDATSEPKAAATGGFNAEDAAPTDHVQSTGSYPVVGTSRDRPSTR